LITVSSVGAADGVENNTALGVLKRQKVAHTARRVHIVSHASILPANRVRSEELEVICDFVRDFRHSLAAKLDEIFFI